MDLRRETDIEQLRRVALAQQVQIEQLLRGFKAKCDELESFKGNPEELQQTLALIETLTKQKQAAAEAASPEKSKTPKKRDSLARRNSPACHTSKRCSSWKPPTARAPSCGGQLEPMAGQFEESELVDFVEVSYRVVKVKQQKYVCR